jgi:hypothetical protein
LWIGIAQWVILRQALPLPQSIIWIGVVSLGWTLGWFVTRAAYGDANEVARIIVQDGEKYSHQQPGRGLE